MQFTSSVLSLLAAATAAVQAIPGPAVEQRQEAPRIYAKFYNDTACGAEGGVWVEDTVWLQEPYDGSCIGVDIWTTFASTLIVDNFATRDLRAYSLGKCDESSNHYGVPAGETGCWPQFIDSVKYL